MSVKIGLKVLFMFKNHLAPLHTRLWFFVLVLLL